MHRPARRGLPPLLLALSLLSACPEERGDSRRPYPPGRVPPPPAEPQPAPPEGPPRKAH